MRPARLLAGASCALAAALSGTTAAAEEYQYPPWVAEAQEAASTCVQKMFAGDHCRSGEWQFSKWDMNIVTVQPARATIAVIQGISEERPRKGMTYIVERTGRGDRPMIHGFPGAPEYLAVANLVEKNQASVLLVTREHFDRQTPDVIRLYRKTRGNAELLASNNASRIQAGNIHLVEESVQGVKSFLALLGDALYLCRGRQTEHACGRFRDVDADVYRTMHEGG
jgi:hypothetical protein